MKKKDKKKTIKKFKIYTGGLGIKMYFCTKFLEL